MRTYRYGDLRDEAYLLWTEEWRVDTRDCAARRPPLRDAPTQRRRVRLWLGAVLLAAGHRLLASVPAPRASA
jgi:hypothetical protein